MPKLRVIRDGTEPRTLDVSGVLTVGRLPPADLVLDDAKVSRRHCLIKPSGAGWIVQDEGSSNGTRVNGRVVKAHPLRAGDKIEVGLTTLVFELDAPRVKFKAPERSTGARDRLRKR